MFAVLYVVQSFPVMVGDMDNTGSLNAQFIHQLTSHIRSKVVLQVRDAHWRVKLGRQN